MKSFTTGDGFGASTDQPKSEAISRDEWLKALSEAGYTTEDDQSAITVGEFRAMFGLTKTTAVNRLLALVESGRAVETKKWGTTPYGRRIPYRAFRLLRGSA